MGFALIFILYNISSMNKIVDINITMILLLNKKFSAKYWIPRWLFEVASQEPKHQRNLMLLLISKHNKMVGLF